ncbi:MAG: hypothetical protein IPH07_34590 [Deltaproteobacteria bacterium]|nr:hypothetical protein [Deltaproteobacteria bacterium]MBK8235309.1 hypothetical protein [Deltaproteobacteria bacterium]MBK8716371.1 hypothetical protein [Deltaproteobacteria bacterium]
MVPAFGRQLVGRVSIRAAASSKPLQSTVGGPRFRRLASAARVGRGAPGRSGGSVFDRVSVLSNPSRGPQFGRQRPDMVHAAELPPRRDRIALSRGTTVAPSTGQPAMTAADVTVSTPVFFDLEANLFGHDPDRATDVAHAFVRQAVRPGRPLRRVTSSDVPCLPDVGVGGYARHSGETTVVRSSGLALVLAQRARAA